MLVSFSLQRKIILTFSEMDLKNRFRKDSSSDIDYSVKTIWNTTGKLLQIFGAILF
jgi:hypothetical protein